MSAIHIALIPKAERDLGEAMRLGRLSRTDTINRAIQAWRFFLEQKKDGKQILVYNPRTKKSESVHFL